MCSSCVHKFAMTAGPWRMFIFTPFTISTCPWSREVTRVIHTRVGKHTDVSHSCYRDELCNLQQLRSDIYLEVTELERLLATRMELAAEGVDIHLHASRSNHQHIVLPVSGSLL